MMDLNAVVAHEHGRTGNDIHLMSETLKGTAQVIDINTLTAAVGIAAVAQQTYF